MEDPRAILERACEQRLPCDILPASGGRVRGTFLRVERGGVVLLAPGARLNAGEDVRCWFTLDAPYSFEASVLRSAVPVPDRSRNGILLGFIDGWRREAPAPPEGLDLLLLPPSGPAVSLLSGPGRVLDAMLDSLVFTLPADHPLVFVAGSRFHLLFVERGPDGRPTGNEASVAVRITETVPGERFVLYTAAIEAVEDHEVHRQWIERLRRAVERGA